MLQKIRTYEFMLRVVVFATLLLLYAIRPVLGWAGAAAVTLFITARFCRRVMLRTKSAA
jgi:hypothetical protein